MLPPVFVMCWKVVICLAAFFSPAARGYSLDNYYFITEKRLYILFSTHINTPSFRKPQVGGNFEKVFYSTCLETFRAKRDLYLKKALTGLAIILLISTLCLILTPQNVSCKTQDIKVVSYNYIIDNLGVLDVPGEIQNIGTDTIESVIVKGTVYGADGTEKASGSVQAWISHMAPGQKAPFMLEFNQPANSDWYTSGISKITFDITEAQAVNSHLYPDLKVTSSATVSTSGDDKGTYWVSGNIKNVGSQTVSKLVVSATFYNSSGHVVSVGLTDYLEPESLGPDSTVSFKVGAYYTDQSAETVSTNQKITSYTLNAQAILPVLDGPATPVPGTSQSGSTQTETTPTEQDNLTGNQNLLYIIIIAGVAVAVIAALLVSRRSKPEPEVPNEVKKKTVYRKKRMLQIFPAIFSY
jgi:hypothetical protein